MLLREVVEEITEKLPPEVSVSPESIVRKVTQIRDQLLRNYGPAQRQSGTLCVYIDLHEGQSLYYLPCPPDGVVEVAILNTAYGGSGEWVRIPHRQFDERTQKPYYYFVAGKIGLYPPPTHFVAGGMKIFYVPVLKPLTTEDMDKPTGFDPDFDMLLVYGVLNDVTIGPVSNQWYEKYQTLLSEYISATNGYERYVVKERW